MICPIKTCRSDIDDDSSFCDQCGAELLICPKCSLPGTGKFCEKDGTKLEPRRNSAPVQPPKAAAPAQSGTGKMNPPPSVSAPANGVTGNIVFPGSAADDALIISHSGGAEFSLRDNDILGRTEGAHASHLSGFRFISRKHATVYKDNGVWCIKDHGATNKTMLNGTILEPEKGYPLKPGDIIHLADQEFTVE